MRTPLIVLGFIVLLGIPWTVNGGAVDIDLHVDKTNWIDPTDPLPVKKPTILVSRHAESSCPLDCSEVVRRLEEVWTQKDLFWHQDIGFRKTSNCGTRTRSWSGQKRAPWTSS